MKRHFFFTIKAQSLYRAIVLVYTLVASPAFGLSVSTGSGGSNAQAVHDLGFTGQGISIGLISQGHARTTHEAFFDKDTQGNPIGNSHADWYDATGDNLYEPFTHDTAVAGIVCSRGGVLYPEDKGDAPEAAILTVKVTQPISGSSNRNFTFGWLADGLNKIKNENGRVVVTGIQLSGTADGDSAFSLLYDYYAYQHNMIFATASGNGASSITIFGDTHNSITTGGLLVDENSIYYKVGSTSNPGPAVDERKKPEITAPSQSQWAPTAGSNVSWADATPSSDGQTSWAVPHTGGVTAVLLSYTDATTEPDDGKNVVIKAVIVNSAFPNIISRAGVATTGLTWHSDRGYGRLDAMRAYEILSSPKITPSSSASNSRGWAYQSLSSGQQHNYTIEGLRNERLLITVTWNRRIQWNDQNKPNRTGYGIIENGELVAYPANLDLEIRDPDGVVLVSNLSTIDNLEKADLLLTKTGSYNIRVVNQASSEATAYGLAFEVLPPLEADFNVDYVVDTQDLTNFAPYWLSTDCTNPLADCFPYNLSPNASIDLGDFSIFAENWLNYDNRYYTP